MLNHTCYLCRDLIGIVVFNGIRGYLNGIAMVFQWCLMVSDGFSVVFDGTQVSLLVS